MMGMAEVGVPFSQDGVASIWIVGASACVIFTLIQKIQKMANKDMTFGYQLAMLLTKKTHPVMTQYSSVDSELVIVI